MRRQRSLSPSPAETTAAPQTATAPTHAPSARAALVTAGVVRPLGAGLICATALPPLGIWPLGVAGFGLFYLDLARRRAGERAVVGLAFGIGYFALGLSFIAAFSGLGYGVLVVAEALFIAVGAAAVPPGRWRPIRFVSALVVCEWARDALPFGGLPIASPALGQAAGPLATLARLGGPLLVVAGAAAFGVFIGTLGSHLVGRATTNRARRVERATTGSGIPSLLGTASVLVLAVAAAASAPSGGRPLDTVRVAAVEGGGPRGFTAAEQPTSTVFFRTLATSGALVGHDDLVVWPEDVVALPGPETVNAALESVLGHEATRLHATLLVGATEEIPHGRFLNEILVFSPTGRLVASYEKIHPVPFGEYVPLRGLLRHLVSLSAVPLDAVPGRRPGLVPIEAGTPPNRIGSLGLAVSYETFYAGIARATVRNGAELLVVPTNTASYASGQLPAEELAASRLDAISTGRDLVQAATTGFSAIVSDSGGVTNELALDAHGDLVGTVTLLDGKTLYDRSGDGPAVVLGLAGVATGLVDLRRRRAAAVSPAPPRRGRGRRALRRGSRTAPC